MNPIQNAEIELTQHPKIIHRHLERIAYIYVRQSTMKQVAQNKESQHYQYRLQQRAQTLGWTEDRIRVIDQDLGLSGSEATARTGFQELVAEVSLGQVGIIFGYEVSRLARNNQDWYHLLDLAAMMGSLIADNDGVYDPRLYNDRLLLGLKGTMSEAELHLLRQRLDQGRMSQVKRGVYRQKLPTGYVRLSDHSVVKDPDDQVRHVIELMFAKFEALRSVNRVVRYLRQEKIQLPRRQISGPHAGQVVWKVACESAVTDMLKNPAYAGVFAHGRRQVNPVLRKAGQPASGRQRRPMAEWLHLQQDVYPAYITWKQYLANQEQLKQNGMRFDEKLQKAQGAVRTGPGLLQGLVVCGRCGHHLRVVYKRTPRYICCGLSRTADVPYVCTSLRAPVVDQVVEKAFFEALQPAHLDALEALMECQRNERQHLERQWQEQLKRAEYAANLAQRQYDAVDPENRMVAAELERRWEERLRQLRQTEEDYKRFQQTPLPDTIPPKLRVLFQDIGRKLPELWLDLTNAQKKELLRSLIKHVVVKRPLPDKIEIRIVWLSGCYTDQTAWTPIHCEQDVSQYRTMLSRIKGLLNQGYNDVRIAEKLTAEGFHSARSDHVSPISVQKIRLARRWYAPFERFRGAEEVNGCFTVRGLANHLGVNPSTVYRLIYKKVICPEDVAHEPLTGFYLIQNDAELVEQLQERVAKNKNRSETGNIHDTLERKTSSPMEVD